jgi:hypothetical protein
VQAAEFGQIGKWKKAMCADSVELGVVAGANSAGTDSFHY